MRRRAFTLTELVIIVAVIAVLAAILFPLYSNLREMVRGPMCHKQQIQVGLGWLMYADDYDGHVAPLATARRPPAGAVFPAARTWWPDLLYPYIKNKAMFHCPSRHGWGIGMNRPEVGRWLSRGPSLSTFVHPDKTIIFADTARVSNPRESDPDRWHEDAGRTGLYFRTPNDLPFYNNDAYRVVNRHSGPPHAVVVFADGRVQPIRASQLGFQYPKGDPRALWDLK